MKDALMQIKEAALEAIKAQDDLDKINDLRVKYLGKKGELTAILKGMGKLSKEERPVIGELANTVRDAISQALEEKSEELRAKALEAKLAGETLDVTLPGTSMPQGHLHPLTQVVNDAKRIFTGLGFEVAEGPEIESDYYNFEALNLPPDHPARDMQDTFYINDKVVLRTQTSGVQVHAMEKMNGKLPVKIIAPGRVYRRDDDATHSPMFHQIEGLLVDEHITMADLKGVLLVAFQEFFGQRQLQRIVIDQQAIDFTSFKRFRFCLVLFRNGSCRQCLYIRFLQRHHNRKVTPFSRNAFQRKRPSHQLDQFAGDGKSQAESLLLFRTGKAGKFTENLFLLFFRDSRTGITDSNRQLAIGRRKLNQQNHTPFMRKLDRIG